MREVKSKNGKTGILSVIARLLGRDRSAFDRPRPNVVPPDGHIHYSMQTRRNDTFGRRGRD